MTSRVAPGLYAWETCGQGERLAEDQIQASEATGKEVRVDFIEGDIDRPVVIGALYNGRGQRGVQPAGVRRQSGALSDSVIWRRTVQA